jgi:hypothetical protein
MLFVKISAFRDMFLEKTSKLQLMRQNVIHKFSFIVNLLF